LLEGSASSRDRIAAAWIVGIPEERLQQVLANRDAAGIVAAAH
jgi:hypothetical protein